jgi:hypothetical protein
VQKWHSAASADPHSVTQVIDTVDGASSLSELLQIDPCWLLHTGRLFSGICT